jgi:hypothetical protein
VQRRAIHRAKGFYLPTGYSQGPRKSDWCLVLGSRPRRPTTAAVLSIGWERVSCIGELTEPISLREITFRPPAGTSRFCCIFTPSHVIASKDVSAHSPMIELCIRKPREVFVGGRRSVILDTPLQPLAEAPNRRPTRQSSPQRRPGKSARSVSSSKRMTPPKAWMCVN